METEKMPVLQQFGPKSLNFVNKKEELKKINQENEILKLKIINAKSSVPPLDDIAIHQSKFLRHKRILKESSPIKTNKLDPLVLKSIKSKTRIRLSLADPEELTRRKSISNLMQYQTITYSNLQNNKKLSSRNLDLLLPDI